MEYSLPELLNMPLNERLDIIEMKISPMSFLEQSEEILLPNKEG